MIKTSRSYALTAGYGHFARTTTVTVECIEERGKFYASMPTLYASPIGVGDTQDEAFTAWETLLNGAAVRNTQHTAENLADQSIGELHGSCQS